MEDEKELTRVVLHLAVHLEAQSRAMLIDSLDPNSKGQILLRADRTLQERVVEGFREDLHLSPSERTALHLVEGLEAEEQAAFEKEMDRKLLMRGGAAGEPLDQIRRYRATYGALLAAGSKLLALEGDDRWLFEKRREDEA